MENVLFLNNGDLQDKRNTFRGLGRCIALTLAKEGYTVLVNYNKSVKEAKELLIQKILLNVSYS